MYCNSRHFLVGTSCEDVNLVVSEFYLFGKFPIRSGVEEIYLRIMNSDTPAHFTFSPLDIT